MYIRKTEDEYTIQGNYGHGWDDETTEGSLKEAKARIKEYRENMPYQYRIVKRRVKLES